MHWSLLPESRGTTGLPFRTHSGMSDGAGGGVGGIIWGSATGSQAEDREMVKDRNTERRRALFLKVPFEIDHTVEVSVSESLFKVSRTLLFQRPRLSSLPSIVHAID